MAFWKSFLPPPRPWEDDDRSDKPDWIAVCSKEEVRKDVNRGLELEQNKKMGKDWNSDREKGLEYVRGNVKRMRKKMEEDEENWKKYEKKIEAKNARPVWLLD